MTTNGIEIKDVTEEIKPLYLEKIALKNKLSTWIKERKNKRK